jgi:hypothetical protein
MTRETERPLSARSATGGSSARGAAPLSTSLRPTISRLDLERVEIVRTDDARRQVTRRAEVCGGYLDFDLGNAH